MGNLSPNQRECAGLIVTLTEGTLSAQERERLNEFCRTDASCRELYLSVMSVHGMLMWTSDFSTETIEEESDDSTAFLKDIYEQARLDRIKHDAELALLKDQQQQQLEANTRPIPFADQTKATQARIIIIPKLMAYGGLAAAILLALVLLWPVLQSSGPSTGSEFTQAMPEAQLTRSEGAVWGQTIQADGKLVGDQAWSLKQGFAEIVMPSGASVILHGPTTFRLIDENKLALDDGRLTAEVPDRAKFFTVQTRGMDVVDLGTRFGVTTENDGETSASVFEGKVEVHEPTASTTATPRKVALTAGQQMRADASGQLAEAITAIQPDHGYVSRWESVQRQVGIQGQARFFNTPPKSVLAGELLDTNTLIVFEESTVVLDQPLSAMINLPEKRTATFVTVPAGRRVVSYFIHTAPEVADKSSFATATLTFPGRVLGVLGNIKSLRETNDLLGLESVAYIPDNDRSTYGIDPGSPDHFAIGGLQGNVLTIHLASGKFADQVRVIVEVPDTFIDR